MSLKSKLPPEVRVAIRLANALKQSALQEPKGTLQWQGTGLLSLVLTGIIGLTVGLGTNFFQAKFQAQENYKVWDEQHRIEKQEKLLSKRIETLSEFEETISDYLDENFLDANLAVYFTFKNIAHTIIPEVDFNKFDLPAFPTNDFIRQKNHLHSKLDASFQSIGSYFGNEIEQEAEAILKDIDAEQTPKN